MENETNNEVVTAADIAKAADVLAGKAETEDKEKAANPFAENADKEKEDKEKATDVEEEKEKSIPASEVAAIVEQAVSKAIDLVKAELFTHSQEVSKGFGAIEEKVAKIASDTQAVLKFQGASVSVLKEFSEVTKGIGVQVDAIGNTAANRKGALQAPAAPEAVEKSNGVRPSIDIAPLWDWMRESRLDTGARFDTQTRVLNGNYSDIPATVLKSMGVEQ